MRLRSFALLFIGLFLLLICVARDSSSNRNNSHNHSDNDSSSSSSSSEEEEEEECSVSREEIVLLTGVYVDANNDNLISKDELQKIYDSVLTKKEKMFKNFAPWVETVDVIMNHCDKDSDGYISIQDFMDSPDTCLNNCEKLETMQGTILGRLLKKLPADSINYYKRRKKMKRRLLDNFKKQRGFESF